VRRSSSCWPSSALLVALALLAAACTPSVQTGDPSLLPSEDTSRPPNTAPPSAAVAGPDTPAASPSAEQDGTLEFRVRDAEGRARPGVPIDYRGPARDTVVTGKNGIARATVPAGTYRITIPVGCVEQLEIFRGSTADAIVYPGTRAVVRLGGIEARAGIWLANPMTWDADPPWSIGDRVRATVTVIDRCRQHPAPDGSSVSWLRWQASPAIEIVGATPTRSDADGAVQIGFRCIAAGVASLLFIDPVTGEREDLLRIRRSFDVIEPTCG